MGSRAAGHDALAARDACPGASDPVVLEPARRERRVAVTEDQRCTAGTPVVAAKRARVRAMSVLRGAST